MLQLASDPSVDLDLLSAPQDADLAACGLSKADWSSKRVKLFEEEGLTLRTVRKVMHEMQDLPIVLDPRALGKHVVSITKNIHFLHLVSSYIYIYIYVHCKLAYSCALVWKSGTGMGGGDARDALHSRIMWHTFAVCV